MTDQQDSRLDELRESLIESLLVSATKCEDHTGRIARAMSQLEAQQLAPQTAGPDRSRTRFLQWGSIGVAATILLALFLLVQTGESQSAIAAIQRSLNVAAQPTTRKYLLQIESQSVLGGTREIEVDLYVHGENRFVLRHPGPLSLGTVWVGKNGPDSWLVPPVGPVVKGDRTTLDEWIRSPGKLGHTADLHIATVLRRMISKGYRLETLADEEITIPNGVAVDCQHIRAERETNDEEDDPVAIELWSSCETAMVMRIIVMWKLEDGEAGKKSVVLTFQSDEPSLTEDWYTAEAHYQGHRPVIRMDPAAN